MASSPTFVEQVGFLVAYIVIGSVAVLINVPVLIASATMKNKKDQRWVLLTAQLIVADTVLSIGYVVKSAISLDQLVNLNVNGTAITTYTSMSCVGLGSVLVAGSIGNQLITLSIALDRALAVSYPTFYHKKCHKITKIVSATTVSITTVYIVGSFIGVPIADNLPFCSFTSGQVATFKSFYYATAHVASLSLIIVYLYLLIIARFRIRNLSKMSLEERNSIQSRELHRQIKVFKQISPLIVVYCLTSVPGFSAIDILPKIRSIAANFVLMNRMLLISQLLISINACVNASLYTWKNDEIWKRVNQLFIAPMLGKYNVVSSNVVSTSFHTPAVWSTRDP